MKLLSLLKPKPETPAEKAALAKLDEVTFEVANEQMDGVELAGGIPGSPGTSGLPAPVPRATTGMPGQ